MLRREIAYLTETLDATEEELELSVGSTGHILRNLVPGQIHRDPGQTALGVRLAQQATTADQTDRRCRDGLILRLLDDESDGRVLRGKEVGAVHGILGEALFAVPCHVVQRHKRSIGEKEVVE